MPRSRSHAPNPAIALTFATLLACKGSDPQPEPEITSASEAAPTPAPAPPPLSDAASTSSTGIELQEPPPEGVAAPAEPAEPAPAPEIETHSFAADADPLLHLLGKGVPEAVELLAVHEHGRERIALYRLDVAAQWAAGQPDADELLEPIAELVEERCSSGYGEVDVRCVEEAKLPNVPAEVAGYHASESDAFELAHVKLDNDTQGTVLARTRLFDHGYPCKHDECFETKLKVYDMDGDGRSEILVVFPLEVVSVNNLGANTTPAALAFVFDKSDLHVQFATTRKFYDYGGDLSTHESTFETSFVARDTNSDGHADLVLREVGTEGRWEEGEDDEVSRTDRSITCLYEYAGDRWVCPSTLGTQLIDGTKLVELTRIPLPPLAAPDAPPTPAPEPGR